VKQVPVGLFNSAMKKFWEYTLVGAVIGLIMGGLLSLVSGNVFVVIMVGIVVTLVGAVLRIIHRNDQ
jgi:cobalamin synthase